MFENHRRPTILLLRRSKSRPYDAGKKISGRKRHILTDTDGRLLAVHVHGADIQDRDGGKGALKRIPAARHAGPSLSVFREA